MSAAPPTTAPVRRESPAGDLWGGFAAMLVVLPSSIAYGVAVYGLLGTDYIGLGVRTGLLGAIALGIVAAALGATPRLI